MFCRGPRIDLAARCAYYASTVGATSNQEATPPGVARLPPVPASADRAGAQANLGSRKIRNDRHHAGQNRELILLGELGVDVDTEVKLLMNIGA